MNRELKVNVGDTVLYYSGSFWNDNIPKITKVTRITPTGRIRIELYSDVQFDKYGRIMGGDSWGRARLEIPTAEKLQEVKQKLFIRRTIRKLDDCNEENISYNQAVAIMAILEGGKPDE